MFVSSGQKHLLTARLLPVIQPPDGGVTAEKIAGAICDWLEFDMIPELVVPAGIAVATTGGPGSTTASGMVK